MFNLKIVLFLDALQWLFIISSCITTIKYWEEFIGLPAENGIAFVTAHFVGIKFCVELPMYVCFVS